MSEPNYLTIVARVVSKPGHAAELVAAQKELVLIARQQPGCILYELHEDEEQAGKVIFFERWTDRAAWEAHINGAHIHAFQAKAGHLVAESELLKMRLVA